MDWLIDHFIPASVPEVHRTAVWLADEAELVRLWWKDVNRHNAGTFDLVLP